MPSQDASELSAPAVPDERKPRADVPRYFRIAYQFWFDEAVRRWDDHTKLFFIYLLTNKHRTLEGFYVLPPEYAAADMRWPLSRVKKMLANIEESGAIRFDPATNLLLIRNALRYQYPESANVVRAIISRVRGLPDNQALLSEFIGLVKVHCSRSGVHAQAQALYPLLEKEYGNRTSGVDAVGTGASLASNGCGAGVGTGARVALGRR